MRRTAGREFSKAIGASSTSPCSHPRCQAEVLLNPRRTAPPQTMLGAAQKAWFLARLRASTARWRLWGTSSAVAGVEDYADRQERGQGGDLPGRGGCRASLGFELAQCPTDRGEVVVFKEDLSR